MKVDFTALLQSGRWMLRFSDDGLAYGGFRWAPVGEWTEAPDWDASPICGGGLHGQGPGGFGDCPVSGSRLELCETEDVVLLTGKLKCRRARILAVDEDAMQAALSLCGGIWPGSLNCRGYAHPLPALTHVGEWLDCRGYAHPLPALTHVGGELYCDGYAHPLPALAQRARDS